jgi:hypothetical protein
MTCPRCGVVNALGRTTCQRCSGSLAPASGAGGGPPAIVPITNRAERAARRAGVPGPAGQGYPVSALYAPPAALAPANPPSPVALEIYLLASERSTGQPAPPDASSGPAEAPLGERRGRMAIGLSGA